MKKRRKKKRKKIFPVWMKWKTWFFRVDESANLIKSAWWECFDFDTRLQVKLFPQSETEMIQERWKKKVCEFVKKSKQRNLTNDVWRIAWRIVKLKASRNIKEASHFRSKEGYLEKREKNNWLQTSVKESRRTRIKLFEARRNTKRNDENCTWISLLWIMSG